MSENNETNLEETELLKLQNLRLRVSAADSRIEAIRQRQNALMIELNVLPDKLKESEAQRKELADAFTTAYASAKESAEIPEGMELNLETGEQFAPNEARQ